MKTKMDPKTWITRLFFAFLVFSMLAAMLPQQASAAPTKATPSCGPLYFVRQGDTLAKIGNKFDVTAFTIADGNDLPSPYTIYVGQRLCIPEKDKSGKLAAKYANAQAAYFTAWFWTGGINVQPRNYPKTTVWVKGDDAGDTSRLFFKIGRLNTKNTGNTTVHFNLPADLKKAKSLTICLKDITSDYNQCVLIPPKK